MAGCQKFVRNLYLGRFFIESVKGKYAMNINIDWFEFGNLKPGADSSVKHTREILTGLVKWKLSLRLILSIIR